jgi:hypothetical protein
MWFHGLPGLDFEFVLVRYEVVTGYCGFIVYELARLRANCFGPVSDKT